MKAKWPIPMIVAGVVSLALVGEANAQPEDERRWLLAGGGVVGNALGDFDDAGSGALPGASVSISYRVQETPFRVGGELTFLRYGGVNRRVPLSLTLPEFPVELSTDKDLLQVLFTTRVQRHQGPLRPYIEGSAGLHYVFTHSSIDLDRGFDDTLAGVTNFDDYAPSLGVGAGLIVPINDWLSLDTQLRWSYGGVAEYLTEGFIDPERGRVTAADIRRSRTDVLNVLIRLGFAF